EGCNRGCKDHVTEVVNPLVDEKSPSGGGCKPPGGEVVTVGEEVAFKTGHRKVRKIEIKRHTASEKDSTASGGRVPPPPVSPPQPQDDGFGGVHGVHGGDTEAVAGEIPEPSDDYQSIAENLAEDRRRQAEEAERTKTPPPKGDEGRAPTSEEAEVLADVAGRILENWPGLPEMLLWEKARDRLGRPISIATVRLWLAAEGYILSSERLNGSPLWNPPAAGEVVG
ncbi:MAG: hypothetical protein PHN90_13325, partial [Methanothrix sp.]|nr:hypothetical protein [Methanothrix sp.]